MLQQPESNILTSKRTITIRFPLLLSDRPPQLWGAPVEVDKIESARKQILILFQGIVFNLDLVAKIKRGFNPSGHHENL